MECEHLHNKTALVRILYTPRFVYTLGVSIA